VNRVSDCSLSGQVQRVSSNPLHAPIDNVCDFIPLHHPAGGDTAPICSLNSTQWRFHPQKSLQIRRRRRRLRWITRFVVADRAILNKTRQLKRRHPKQIDQPPIGHVVLATCISGIDYRPGQQSQKTKWYLVMQNRFIRSLIVCRRQQQMAIDREPNCAPRASNRETR
jgi:hypothetical protein